MNTLAWFFFKLLIFEYIEDSGTEMAFRLPGGHCWKIFVEVLHAQDFTVLSSDALIRDFADYLLI